MHLRSASEAECSIISWLMSPRIVPLTGEERKDWIVVDVLRVVVHVFSREARARYGSGKI